ncbi:MAG: GTP cyclohydrolase I FolE2 [Rubrivivax sp.]|nr:GTP cyclohydrolase I FolE2 [Rubrivivax sp.]
MNNLTDALHIPDTQSARDHRHLAIQRVGVKDLRYPLTLRVAGAPQTCAATWALDVALPAEQKGTHMSRFVAWLDELHACGVVLDAHTLRERHGQMLTRLAATAGRAEAAFAFFLRKRAPVSGLTSLLDYRGRWIAETPTPGMDATLWAEVGVPVKSLCPCSKEISDYGAHNQRAVITLRVELLQAVEWHELVRLAEEEASSEIWPMLKRPDEKWVTERAYENPKFVEDLVRDVALRIEREPRIGRYVVEVENIESIHNHSAYARIERA